MIDHLLLYGSDTEGIFRKSPKQQTVRILRQQLDQGQVPDFHQFNVHVTASLLKVRNSNRFGPFSGFFRNICGAFPANCSSPATIAFGWKLLRRN